MIEARHQDDVGFLQADVVDTFCRAPRLTADAYIFPKSISEFSRNDIESICMSLAEKTPAQKKVYFLFSLRTDDRSMERDMIRTNQLFRAMLANGFISEDDPNRYMILSEELQGRKIKDVDRDFRHPWDVVNFLSAELKTYCSTYAEQGEYCKADCEDRLQRWPILSCQQVRWQLFEFTKEG